MPSSQKASTNDGRKVDDQHALTIENGDRMTPRHKRVPKSSSPTAAPLAASQPPSEPHPLFRGMTPFEATMLRVAMQDLHEDGLGSRPFIAATAELAPEARRDLLIRASATLLGHCDRYGAAECLTHALGLEHVDPSEELNRVIEGALEALSEAAAGDDGDESEEDAWSTEDLVRLIDEVHQTPSS